MIIFGIDPGSRQTGYAVLSSNGTKFSYISSGVFHFHRINSFNERLGHIFFQMKQKVKEFRPDEIAIESLIYVKDPRALMKLAQARGALIASLIPEYKNCIYEYSPNQIKAMTTGYGHASKENIQKFLKLFLGLKEFQTHDESDAIAIALCHALNKNRTTSINSKLNVIRPNIADYSES